MSDYEYENGEEYIDDPDFTVLADAAYELVDRDMPGDTPVQWRTMCERYFDMEVADHENKAEWTLHVASRNAMMGAVNHRAQLYGKPWRLYIAQQGESIMKAVGRRMVEMEIERRMRKVGGAYSLIEKRLSPMLGIASLTRRDRAIISQMLDVARGARLATAGMIDRLEVARSVRRMLHQTLDITYPTYDDGE